MLFIGACPTGDRSVFDVISTEANGASRERSGEISRERNATIVHEYRNLLPLGSPSNALNHSL